MHFNPGSQQSPKQQACVVGQQADWSGPKGQHCSSFPQQSALLAGSEPGPQAVSPRSKAQQPSLVQISRTVWLQHSLPQTFSSGQHSSGRLQTPPQHSWSSLQQRAALPSPHGGPNGQQRSAPAAAKPTSQQRSPAQFEQHRPPQQVWPPAQQIPSQQSALVPFLQPELLPALTHCPFAQTLQPDVPHACPFLAGLGSHLPERQRPHSGQPLSSQQALARQTPPQQIPLAHGVLSDFGTHSPFSQVSHSVHCSLQHSLAGLQRWSLGQQISSSAQQSSMPNSRLRQI
ncbi:MAG: hypothetical protein QOF01_1623 [Thermomicrobiales bacterium]|jgi:hypothetical protein|nr:hypothetical protein [Thermomicrobiales bacterium]MEA2595154.1 hypothetical protein [Thermomicrobiales bacterium]